jgi:Circadian oscillating protein COP23
MKKLWKWFIPSALALVTALILGASGGFTVIVDKIQIFTGSHQQIAQTPIVTSSQNDRPTFKCEVEDKTHVMVGQFDGKSRPLIRFVSDNWGAEYKRETRCNMVSNTFNNYIKTHNPPALTTGKKNGYAILCVSKGKGDGCLNDDRGGQIMTWGKDKQPNQELSNLIAQVGAADNETAPGPIENEPRKYIYLKEFILRQEGAIKHE